MKTLARNPVRAGLTAMIAGFMGLLPFKALSYGPGCPFCTGLLPVVPTSKPVLRAKIKWAGIEGAPSINNPLLVCQPDFKRMLWQRERRASGCIWTPQARILMSSPFFTNRMYVRLRDLDTSTYMPGDLVACNGSCVTSELIQTFEAAELVYHPPTTVRKGVIALSARRIYDNLGTFFKGLAVRGSVTRPWMAVCDPIVLVQDNERTLAHEFGHVLGLAHDSHLKNLMESAGAGARLSSVQCKDTRIYLTNNPSLDPPAGPDLNLVAMTLDDPANRLAEAVLPPYLNIYKLVAVDQSATGGSLSFHIGTDGIIPTNASRTIYWVLLDTDNNPATGGTPTNVITGSPMGGVELVAEAVREIGGNIQGRLYRATNGGVFVEVPGAIQVGIRDISLVLCEDDASDPAIPFFSEIDFTLTNSVFSLLGWMTATNHGLFPNDLRVQAISGTVTNVATDYAPANGDVMSFPVITYPALSLPAFISLGQSVPVSVSGLATNAALIFTLGDTTIAITNLTDSAGAVSFQFVVPTNTLLSTLIVSAATEDLDDARLANEAVTVYDASAPLQLFVTREANEIILSWQSPDTLESATQVTGPWAPILDDGVNAGSPWYEPIAGSAKYFRLRR